MAQSKQRKRAKPHKPDLAAASSLLAPILKFLAASGLSLESAQEAFTAAWHEAGVATLQVKIKPLAKPDVFREIVATWVRTPDFLDQDGNPRILPLRGKRSFSALIGQIDSSLSIESAVDELKRYGNVRRLPKDRLKLLKSFFHIRSGSMVAFEPSARFLADASTAINGRMSEVANGKSYPQDFWRTAEAAQLPAAQVGPYLEFVRRRSLVCLQEVDEWLQAHAVPESDSSASVRAGLGLFTICCKN
jgi:hypothetical protein